MKQMEAEDAAAKKRPGMVFRADATTEIGTGHLMRCEALAQAWERQQGETLFLVHNPGGALIARIESGGRRVIAMDRPYPDSEDLTATLRELERVARRTQQRPWLIVDGYHFDASYCRGVRVAGFPIAVIDDHAHLARYDADVIVNQNIDAEQLTYPCDPQTICLLGCRYAMLREEFYPWSAWQRTIPPVAARLLVTLGGGDPQNATQQVMDALKRVDVPGLEVAVVVGAENPHRVALEAFAGESAGRIRLHHRVSNISELMAWADLAVSAGGTTCWELASLGVPSLVFILAENQRLIAEGLGKAGIAVNLGWCGPSGLNDLPQALTALAQDANRRALMSEQGRRLVDGKGATRVAEALQVACVASEADR